MASLPYPEFAPVSGHDLISGPEQRRSERLEVMLPAKLTLLAGEYDCALDNISQTGARIIMDVALRTGQECLLTCSPLDIHCVVAWTSGNSAGVEFTQEISLGAVRQLRWQNDCNRKRHDAALAGMLQGWTDTTSSSAGDAGKDADMEITRRAVI